MPIEWIKKGHLYRPNNDVAWMASFAQVPCPIVLKDRIRVFFSCRPEKDAHGNSLSYVTYVDLELSNPGNIIYLHKTPVLELGGTGDFDEFGIHPASLIFRGEDIYFYYQGWERGYSVPYKTSLGLAISKDGGNTFRKVGKGPLFSRTVTEPYLENGFFVLKDDAKYHMWYSTCTEWIKTQDKIEPYYFLVHAESDDGMGWNRDPSPIIKPGYPKEVNGRATVAKINGLFHMWFNYRDIFNFRGGDGSYKIGYAYSEDLVKWTRDDERAGITLSAQGWDSSMMSYPHVVQVRDRWYLFYNGNEFGKDGFGYAEAKITD